MASVAWASRSIRGSVCVTFAEGIALYQSTMPGDCGIPAGPALKVMTGARFRHVPPLDSAADTGM